MLRSYEMKFSDCLAKIGEWEKKDRKKKVAMSVLDSVINPIKDFFFVTVCFHCGERLNDSESRVCSQCWQSLTPVCPDDFTLQVMEQRFREEGIIDEFIPLCYFEKGKVLQSLVHSLKYEEISTFGKELGYRIGFLLKEKNIAADVIIPVPLNKRKERERGYNQSEFIANGIGVVTGIPMLLHAVKRIKYTMTQTRLTADERKENVSDAFNYNARYAAHINGKAVVIVDDVITTGSTVQEVGRVLKNNGARKVIAASAGLARLGEDG